MVGVVDGDEAGCTPRLIVGFAVGCTVVTIAGLQIRCRDGFVVGATERLDARVGVCFAVGPPEALGLENIARLEGMVNNGTERCVCCSLSTPMGITVALL